MRSNSSTRVPKYRLHTTGGLGVVHINGKDVYPGKHVTCQRQAEYRRVLAGWLCLGRARHSR